MKAKLTLLATLSSVVLAFGADTESTSTAPEATPSGKKLKLALITNNDADYWHLAQAGSLKAVEQLGDVDVEFLINKSGDSAGQLRLLNQVMATKPDGVAVSVVDVFDETDPLTALAEQTLLVCFDSDASPSKRAGYVGTDNIAAGVQAGELIKECLPEGGSAMLFVGNGMAQNAIQRTVGIRKALKDSGVEIIDTLLDGTDRARARKNVEETLATYPDIDCLVGLWSYEGPAILEAVREAGKIGKVHIVCFDDDPQTLVGIGWGAIDGTVVQDPFEIGRQTVIAMESYLRGDNTAFGGNKLVYIPTKPIKQNDVASYLVEQGKLLRQ